MKTIKPFQLFESKSVEAFFCPLDSNPLLGSTLVSDSIRDYRLQILCRIAAHVAGILSLNKPTTDSAASSNNSTPCITPTGSRSVSPPNSNLSSPQMPISRNETYSFWVDRVMRLAREFCVDEDEIRQALVYELYSYGYDKVAEEALPVIKNHSNIGEKLLLLAGKRLNYSLFCNEESDGISLLSKCPPILSTWIKSMEQINIHCEDVCLKDTIALIGQIIDQLPEQHSEYNKVIQLVDLVQSVM